MHSNDAIIKTTKAGNSEPAAEAKHTTAKFGKTFYFASLFMGKRHAQPAYELYQYCRYLDDIADGDEADAEQQLVKIQQNIKQSEVNGNVTVSEQVCLPSIAVNHMIDGFLFDQHQPIIETEDELITYCYQVAGTVGLMMCKVLNVTDQNSLNHAVDLGIAMQLTNIARDIHEDASMARRYVPACWIDNMTPTDIVNANSLEQKSTIKQAQVRLLDLAEHYYASAFSGLHYLPERVRFAIYIAAQCYRQIGGSIRNTREVDERAFVSLLGKLKVTVRCYVSYYQSKKTAAFVTPHNPVLHQALAKYYQPQRVKL